MSVPADQMDARRRIPVARPAVQQLALPAPAAPPPAPPLGTPATTVVPPSGDTIAVDRAGRASVSNIQPRTPATAAAQLGGRPGTMYVTPEGTASNNVFEARSAAVRERMAAGRPPPTAAPLTTPGPTPATAAAQLGGTPAAPPPAANAAAAANAERSAAYQLGQRFAPVARALAPLRPLVRAIGGTGVTSALYGAGKGFATETDEYADRFGVQPIAPGDTSAGGVAKDVALRTAGVASDVLAAVPDMAIGLGNLPGQFIKSKFPNAPDWLTNQMPTMSDLYDNSEMRTRIQREAAANDGVVPAGIALAMGPNGELPKALPEFNKPTAAQVSAAINPGQKQGGIQTPASPPPQGQPQNQQGSQKEGQSPDDVVGEINGRKITRGESDRLSKQNVVPGYTGNAAEQLRGPRDTGPRVFMPKGDDRATIEKIDKAISDLGPLDRRGKRQALVDLLGLRQRGVASDLDRGQRDAASQLSADVDREQIAATAANNARRQNTQTIADAKGYVYSVEGNTLTPLTKPDGSQLVAGVSKAQTGTGYELADAMLKQAAEAGAPIDSAAILGAQQAQQQYNFAKNTPAGYRVAQAKDGSLVYVDADGNQIEPE